MRVTISKLAELARFVDDASSTYGASKLFVARRFARLYFGGQFSPIEIFGQGLVDPALERNQLNHYISKERAYRWFSPINDHPERAIIDDKRQFQEACAAQGLPTPVALGVYSRTARGQADAVAQKTRAEWAQYLLESAPARFVAKPSLGLKGYGVTVVKREGSRFVTHDLRSRRVDELIDYFEEIVNVPTIHPKYDKNEQVVLLQAMLETHPDLAVLSATDATQCVRVCTYIDSGRTPRILFAFLKIITGDNPVDNFAQGKTGNLLGFLHETQGTLARVIGRPRGQMTARVYQRHPTSAAHFENFRVPMWSEVCELAKKAASAFWPVGAVGWDIAVTREGPVLVEGNTVWDPVAPLYFPLPLNTCSDTSSVPPSK